jgi:2-oxoglutarate ferredoxin oxidoreductase subunit alpha
MPHWIGSQTQSPHVIRNWMEERSVRDLSIFIVGAAGEGIQTIGDVVAHALLKSGVAVFTSKEYESRIRGGHNSYRLRVSGPNAPRHDADVILALNSAAFEHYRSVALPGATILGELPAESDGLLLRFQAMAKEAFGSAIFVNTLAAGALGAVVGLSPDIVQSVVESRLSKLSDEVLEQNVRAVRMGFEAASKQMVEPENRAELTDGCKGHAFASVHEIIPLAAAAAGCRFMAAYPMSPSTGIMTAFARDPDLGVFVEQAEDEIAAVNMSLAASAAGARSMTATSGGGFALMTEGLSLAGMTETPLVFVLAQRPGPATGLPTRTAQEDLSFALYGGHGEFPRAILAPADPQDAARLTHRAFDLADRYQIPVIILTDQFLADAHFSLDELTLPAEAPPLGLADPSSFQTYERYRWTSDGVSPRLALGQSEHLVCIDSDEHTEAGHITEDLVETRPAMVEKRLEKLRRLRQEMAPPESYRVENAETVQLSWGSSRGSIHEAVDRSRDRGMLIGALHFTELWPLPDIEPLEGVAYWTIEGNAVGQFARLLRAEAAFPLAGSIERYDGLPIDAASIVAALFEEDEEAPS